jgi:hypothetical protein
VALCLSLLVTAGALSLAWVSTTSLFTRVLVTLVELPVLVMLGTCLLGTWRWHTLCYALTPSALEVRYGMTRLRIRYEDVDGVVRAEGIQLQAPALLWPGAPAGDVRLEAGAVTRWWGTTVRRTHRVVVEAGAGGVVLTPSEPEGFCGALWANIQGTEPGSAAPGQRPPGWLDRVASLDGWYRVLTLLAFGVAAAGIAARVLAMGTLGHPSTIATIALLVNAALGLIALRRSPGLARVIMSGTIALQGLGLLL